MFKGSGPMKQNGGTGSGRVATLGISRGEPRPTGVMDRCSTKGCAYPSFENGKCKACLHPHDFRANRGKSWLRLSSNVNVLGYGSANQAHRAKYHGK